MNTHPEKLELMAFHDGEPVSQSTIDHIHTCDQCTVTLCNFQSVSGNLAKWTVESPDPAHQASLNAALSSATSIRPHRFAFLRGRPLLYAATGACAVIALSVFFLPVSVAHKSAKHEFLTSLEAPPDDKARSYGLSELVPPPPAPVAALRAGGGGGPLSGVAKMVAPSQAMPSAPMIARTAAITITVSDVSKAQSSVEEIVRQHSGYLGDLTLASPQAGDRKLTATLRVPAAQLDATLSDLKKLGRVESQSQNAQEVTDEYADLEARLTNDRNTEKRLTELLRQQSGKLADVLEVETEISRVRGEIESKEAATKLLSTRVAFANVTATIAEEYKVPADAVPFSTGTRFRNAMREGYRTAVESLLEIALFLLGSGPTILLWLAILFFPARYAWLKFRRR